MNDVMTRCVSLATGALSPDLRANYEFGLVLGVDDFRQEQMYLLEKDYLYNRALHGFGTAYGLRVTAERQPDTDPDVLITVHPGMGLDQWGRPVVVRTPQCARLGAWLAKHPPPDDGGATTPPVRRSAYVVAAYAECTDALVPVPGQPCSSSDTTRVPSRIRDSYDIELRWAPPAMPAWDAVRRFAELMARVRIVPGMDPTLSDEAAIIDLVRALDAEPPASPPAPPTPPRLPAETAREALDRIFVVWVTEVRPRLRPNLTDPSLPPEGEETAGGAGMPAPETSSEPAILLARIDFEPADPFDANAPRITVFDPPRDDGRPYLLHTQLIQELLLLGGTGEDGKPRREFATLQVRNSTRLLAWVHHPAAIEATGDLKDALTLTSNGTALTITGADQVTGIDNLFSIVTDQPIEASARVELQFRLGALQIRGGGPLGADLDGQSFAYVGRDGDTITAYTFADRIPATREFVTFRAVPAVDTPGDEPGHLLLWFHTDGDVELPAEITALQGRNRTPKVFTTRPVVAGQSSAFWILEPADGTLRDRDFLAFPFDTDTITTGGRPLTEALRDGQPIFIGHDGEHTIQAFYDISLPARVVAPAPDIREELLRMPSLPFVTVTTGTPQLPTDFNLWFHLDQKPSDSEFGINIGGDREPFFQVFAEVGRGPDAVPNVVQLPPESIQIVRRLRANVYFVRIEQDRWTELSRRSPYLRFVFPLDLRLTRGQVEVNSLGEFIRSTGVKFTGHNGGDEIVSYVRLPLPVGERNP